MKGGNMTLLQMSQYIAALARPSRGFKFEFHKTDLSSLDRLSFCQSPNGRLHQRGCVTGTFRGAPPQG